ncbi:hypothetical protein BHM03_00041850 [Ensete ventricosum]|nr:hypothetical protein BHM03_00041850 [Ensete ventricosum]
MSFLILDQFLSRSLHSRANIIGEDAAVATVTRMYSAERPCGVDFHNGGLPPPPPPPQQQPQMILAESSGEDHEVRAPKKRAETWIQEETKSLIALRREIDGLFNTSKSNRHLWEQISTKMREKGFDRSPTMCTDKWRNLLKEFKKAKHQIKGSGSVKMSYYKELDELLKERNKKAEFKSSAASKVDAYLQFPDKGAIFLPFSDSSAGLNIHTSLPYCFMSFSFVISHVLVGLEDANIPFGPVEGIKKLYSCVIFFCMVSFFYIFPFPVHLCMY